MHLAFVVPGVLFPEKSVSRIDAEDALLTFRTNTIGPMLVLKHFNQFIPTKSFPAYQERAAEIVGLPPIAKVALMSARVGSISDNKLGGWYSYRASKAGVNQVAKTFDNHLLSAAGDRAMCVALHPGTAKTDLSKAFWKNVKEGKLLEPDFVAERLFDVVKSVGLKGRGRCWDYLGKEVMP